LIASTRKPLPEPDPEFRFDPAGDLSAIAARELLFATSGADNPGSLNAAVTVGPEALL